MAHFRKRGKTWYCYYYIADPETGEPKQKSKGGFRTRGDAVAWNTRREADRLRGFTGAPEDLTITQLVRLYLDSRPAGRPSPASMNTYEGCLRRYITPYIGAVPAAKLTSMDVQRWHNDLLAHPLAPNTIQQTHSLLSSSIETAVNNGMLLRNPAKLVAPPTAPRTRRTRLDTEQVRPFLEACERHKHGLLFQMILFTLARPGEMLALRWEDVDWKRGTIHIHRTRKRDANGVYYPGEGAKSRSGNRTVVIHDALLARLRQHRLQQNKHRLQFAELWHDLDLVFPRDNGQMLVNNTMDRALRTVCADAGVPRLTPHEVRHTGASLMVDMNENLKVISERLGHSSIAMTADIYLEVSEGLQRQVSERMARAFDSA